MRHRIKYSSKKQTYERKIGKGEKCKEGFRRKNYLLGEGEKSEFENHEMSVTET